MTGRVASGPLLEFEAFGAAVGLTLACGALSAFVPLLAAPTATLAALALAGWVSRTRRRGLLSWSGLRLGPALALGALGIAAVAFLAPPPFLAPVRGLLLAGGLLPLLVTDRFCRGPRAFDLPSGQVTP
jgi:hypothetical protein